MEALSTRGAVPATEGGNLAREGDTMRAAAGRTGNHEGGALEGSSAPVTAMDVSFVNVVALLAEGASKSIVNQLMLVVGGGRDIYEQMKEDQACPH